MKRSTIAKFAAAGVIGAFALGNPLPASAGGPEIFHERFHDEQQNQDVCGINVDVVADGVFTGREFFDADGNFVRFLGTVSGTNTFTNDAGESVVVRFANMNTDTESIDEEAGTITIFNTVKGLPELMKTPHGGVLTRDAGVIGFVITIDLDTEEEISVETVVNRGPHPEADSDFELFCEVMRAELG